MACVTYTVTKSEKRAPKCLCDSITGEFEDCESDNNAESGPILDPGLTECERT